ncbi:unnamed protein product [Prunus armeniaca]|uniref:Uncharacterized protein n=1 Tax=Prunus armeniaca TaxID=36596 RepID=A0A6J5X4T3_PRUAR|nr:unnamed protein product [Prunus armeniaca]
MAAQRKNPQIENVLMMLPSSIRCTACSTVMAKGTKLNSRKEEALDEKEKLVPYTDPNWQEIEKRGGLS